MVKVQRSCFAIIILLVAKINLLSDDSETNSVLGNNLGETSGRLEARMATMCFLLLGSLRHRGQCALDCSTVFEDCVVSWTRQLEAHQSKLTKSFCHLRSWCRRQVIKHWVTNLAVEEWEMEANCFYMQVMCFLRWEDRRFTVWQTPPEHVHSHHFPDLSIIILTPYSEK